MISQEAVELIRTTFSAAVEQYNAIAKDKILDNEKNFDVAAKYLQVERLPQDKWFNQNVWFATLGQVAINLDTVVVKTREQIEKERHAADRAPGLASAQKGGTSEPLKNPLKELSDTLSGLFKNAEASPAPTAIKVEWPPFDKDVEDMSPENRKLFRKLSSEDTRKWMAKRRDYIATHRKEDEEETGS